MTAQPMRDWIAASVVFFAYVIVAALVVRQLPSRRRVLAVSGSSAALLALWLAHGLTSRLLNDWIVPPFVLLAAYWLSGLLFSAPMPRVERTFERIDNALGVDDLAAAAPTWFAELLEIAYIAVYPVVPAALAIRFLTTADPAPERFWTVILTADFICFGFLPWVQTRPPRAVRTLDPWRARVRHANLQLLGRTSIQVNTFPSGHAAEALASALLVIDAPPAFAAAMAIVAVLISAGTVLGRYHYAADAVAGWMVAAGVWMVMR